MKQNTGKINTRFLVELAVLIAIELLLEVTNLGYIKTGFLPFSVTIMQIPVIVGAIVLGPSAGLMLGAVFGLTSFFECFGKDPTGVALMSISPLSTFILCFVPRVLMGFLCALVFKALKGIKKTFVRCGISSLSGALFNTFLFMGFLVALFAKTALAEEISKHGGNVLKYIIAAVGVQSVVEAIVCCIVGASVSYALLRYKNSKK